MFYKRINNAGCWVPRNNLPKVWISFKYEKLQDLCFNCGVIGHEQRFCKEDKETPSRYGQRLSVPPAKEWSLILEERKRWQQRSRENTRSNPASNQNDFQNNDRTQQDALVVRKKEHVRREGVSFDGVGEERLQIGGMASASRRAQQQSRSVREISDYGPVNNLPFTNLRVHRGIPGFPGLSGFHLDTRTERRFGEYPWRPKAKEVGQEAHEVEDDSSDGIAVMRVGITDTNLLNSDGQDSELVTGRKGEREKGKIVGGSITRAETLVLGSISPNHNGYRWERERDRVVSKGKSKIWSERGGYEAENPRAESESPFLANQEEEEGQLPSGWTTDTPEVMSPATMLLYQELSPPLCHPRFPILDLSSEYPASNPPGQSFLQRKNQENLSGPLGGRWTLVKVLVTHLVV